MSTLPLCVDMDGTLLKVDTLTELLVRVLKQQPWLLLWLPVWLLQGKAVFKRELARRCELDPLLLPPNTEFLNFLRREHQQGRRLYLVTGAYITVAERVAKHYGFFADVLATTDTNLVGENKAARLVELFGERQFDYAGNSRADCACWRSASQCYLVNANTGFSVAVRKQVEIAREFDRHTGVSIRLLLQALRLHQWAKNILVLVPLLASHRLFDWIALSETLIAFVAFGCCASLAYILNDLSDLDADRQHRSKCHRPFASGALPIVAGLGLALALLLVTLQLTYFLPTGFTVYLLLYFVVTNLYTLRLKQVPILDIAILAGLYTLRVVAGGFTAHSETSFWLLAFSCFIFFSLAIVKRLSELQAISTTREQPVQCRGYWTSDMPVLMGLGTASAMMAVLVLALYINSPDVVELYSSPRYLWLLCPIIALWLGRVWLITGRGEMHDDPVVFALRDRSSWLLFAVAALCMVIGATM